MPSLHRRVLVSVLCGAIAPAALVVACGSDGGSSSGTMQPASGDANIDRERLAAPIVIHPEAGVSVVDAGPDAPAEASSCTIVIDTPPLLPGTHVQEGTPITWSSNPPSSGPHYPIWANFQEFDQVVDLGYVVHSMEHGAVVLFTQCVSGPDCDAIRAGFRQVRDAIPADPLCDPSIRVRVVMVADPLLDVPIAAASWGWTYKANCLDVPSLTDFAKAHIAQGTENICAPGQATF